MILPFQLPTSEKRIDSDYYVEGFATTFNKPYLLYELDGIKYYEEIDRNALDDADLSDVIMQYDHREGACPIIKQNPGIEPNDNGLLFMPIYQSRRRQRAL